MFKRYNGPMKNNVLTFELIKKLKYPLDFDISSSGSPRIYTTIIPDSRAHTRESWPFDMTVQSLARRNRRAPFDFTQDGAGQALFLKRYGQTDALPSSWNGESGLLLLAPDLS